MQKTSPVLQRFSRLIPAFTFACLCISCGGGGSGSATVVPPPGPVFTAVNAVQGDAGSSPIEGNNVLVSGVVTGDFQAGDATPEFNLGGFYIQEETPDTNPATSEGIFVSEGAAMLLDVSVGDKVSVDGQVQEYFGETQIVASSISITGTGTIQATDIALPLAVISNSDGVSIADLEAYEGMLVRFPQTLSIGGLYNLGRYGEMELASDGRIFRMTNQSAPGIAAYAQFQLDQASRSIIVDDGLTSQNPDPPLFLIPDETQLPGHTVRAGDALDMLTGNVRFSRGSGGSGTEAYRIEPNSAIQYRSLNPRDPDPPVVGGSLRLASFNVLNFFTNIDSGQSNCGPVGASGCRGADSAIELERQRNKILTALAQLDAHIVGLVELENTASASLESIVDGLNAVAGNNDWAYVDSGTIGSDAIKVGFIYRTSMVASVGSFAILDSSIDARFDDMKSRPVLLQTFTQLADGATVNVAISHLKSKGSSCDSLGDPDIGDGQGNCNVTRTSAALALGDWLNSDPTNSGDPDVLLLGDLNAYLQEDPLTVLKAAGFSSLLETLVGMDAYSFQFNASSGALDHALTSASLTTQVSGAAEWHINADEPTVLDYNLEFSRDPLLFNETEPYRSSDHDPLLVGLTLTVN